VGQRRIGEEQRGGGGGDQQQPGAGLAARQKGDPRRQTGEKVPAAGYRGLSSLLR